MQRKRELMSPQDLSLGLGTQGSDKTWFVGAGFGVFVHWDHASQQGLEISWPLVGRSTIPGRLTAEDDVTVGQYQSTAASFSPVKWDARALARLVREAGATYAVFTARHHAGYSMFESAHSDFSIMQTVYGRDLTKEFVEAVRAEGIKVGLYYSLSDWHHPDYPEFTDSDRPYPGEREPEFSPLDTADRHRRSAPAA